MSKEYLVDGVFVDWERLVEMARKKYGYDDEILSTSGAARILRENGHVVSEPMRNLND